MDIRTSLFIIFCLTCATNAEPVPGKAAEDSKVSRFVRDTGFIRSKYQSGDVCEEGDNTLCLPEGVTGDVPSSLVDCQNGQCVCNDCFMINDSNGRCRLCSDYPLLNRSVPVCGVDDRPSQLTAFLLSLFLASTGAANFYIGRDELGGGQLFVLLMTFFLSYAICCVPICLACCLDKENMKGSLAYICLMLIFVLAEVAASLILVAWWLADLIIFITNQRLAGSGCELSPTL